MQKYPDDELKETLSYLGEIHMQSMLQQARQDVVGRVFVVGRANTHGEFTLVMGEHRYVIPDGCAKAGERVRIIGVEEEVLRVEVLVNT